jgi:hypothetical protein
LISLPDADALLRRQMKLVAGLGKRRRRTGDHDHGNQPKAMILRKIFRSRRASGEPESAGGIAWPRGRRKQILYY